MSEEPNEYIADNVQHKVREKIICNTEKLKSVLTDLGITNKCVYYSILFPNCCV